MLNDALFYNPYEIIGGEKFMAAMAFISHSGVIMRLGSRIFEYVDAKKCGYVFTDNVDIHFPDGNLFRPDLTVITKENSGIINWKGSIHGVPDMVVEVLSKSTHKNDWTIKKDAYETNGVKEYWIIDIWAKIVTVFHLRNGKFQVDESYTKYSSEEWDALNEEEKANHKSKIKISFFEDLYINVDDIFAWSYDT